MAKETKITRKQLTTLLEQDLIVPVSSSPCTKKQIQHHLGMESYRAKRLDDMVKMRKFDKFIKEMDNHDNLIFARYQHPQGMPLLLSQSNGDEEETISKGYIEAPGEEEFVLDLGRTITVSGGDDFTEQRYSFEKGEIFATSEEAAKNWKFDLRRTLIEGLDEELTQEEIAAEISKIDAELERITILVPKIVELDEAALTALAKTKGGKKKVANLNVGQLTFEFEQKEEVMEKEVKTSIFDCVIGEWRGAEATMDDVVVCKKIIPTGEYIFDVELVFYNSIKKYVIPVEENGVCLRNEDGTIVEKIVEEQTPLMDCRIYAYESAIQIDTPYSFEDEILEAIKDITISGNSIVAATTEDGKKVYLHSFNRFFENEEFEYAKNYVIANKKSKGVKKTEIDKMVNYAVFLEFCLKHKIPKNEFEAKKFATA